MSPSRVAHVLMLLGLLFGFWLPARTPAFTAPSAVAPAPASQAAGLADYRAFLPMVWAAGALDLSALRPRRPTRTPTATATATRPAAQPTNTPTQTPPVAQPTNTPTRTPPVAQPTNTPTQTPPAPQPTNTPTATPTAVQPTATPTVPAAGARWWGLIGNDGLHLADEYAAGIRYKMICVRWKSWFPAEGSVDMTYVNRKLAEMSAARAAGFQVILSTGIHDAPDWVHNNYANSYYKNQYGDVYTDGLDDGDVNFVFNPQMRGLAEAYLTDLFARLGTNFAAVRVGGGRYGELTYPPAAWNGHSNSYWDFDANAQAQSPVPGWLPGSASPNGEAASFLEWHLQKLVELQNWNFNAVRQRYPGPIMILYPSWGIRPGDIQKAVATNLNGSSSAEHNGEIQRGFDFARQVNAITDAGAIVTTTWLDASGSQDGGADQRYWSPVHYLSSLANAHPLPLKMYGENTGHGSAATMDFTASQMTRYGLLGFAWYNEAEILSGSYATLADYTALIQRYGP